MDGLAAPAVEPDGQDLRAEGAGEAATERRLARGAGDPARTACGSGSAVGVEPRGRAAEEALIALAGARFWKMSGGGNDFVAFDNRDRWFPAGEIRPALVTALCARGTGVGADAVLLLEPPEEPGADFRMVYYNADGSEAPMCGNGALCIASLADELGAVTPRSRVEGELAAAADADLLR